MKKKWEVTAWFMHADFEISGTCQVTCRHCCGTSTAITKFHFISPSCWISKILFLANCFSRNGESDSEEKKKQRKQGRNFTTVTLSGWFFPILRFQIKRKCWKRFKNSQIYTFFFVKWCLLLLLNFLLETFCWNLNFTEDWSTTNKDFWDTFVSINWCNS